MSPKACYLLVGVLVVFCVIPEESDAYTEATVVPWWDWQTTDEYLRNDDITTQPRTTERETPTLPEETYLPNYASLSNGNANAATGIVTAFTPSEVSTIVIAEATTVPTVTGGQKPCNNNNNNDNNNNNNNIPIKKIDRGTDINLNIKVPRQAESRVPNSGPLLEMLLSINE